MTKKLLFTILVIFCGTGHNALEAQPAYDWHISGGSIVDGTGKSAYRADVLLRADTIAFIGDLDADTIRVKNHLNASGYAVTPGFIDVHAHGSPVRTPEFRNFLAMGVTTILLGQDGSSPTSGSLAEWFAKVQEAGPGVNIATLSGHGSLRSKVGVGHRPAVEKELHRMKQLLREDLEAGSFGLSTGLEYVPGMYADQGELLALAEVVGDYDSVLMSHMRSEDDSKIIRSINELAALGSHTKLHLSHLKVVYGKGEERAEQVLTHLDSLRRSGIRITADTYPYSASYTGIGIVFPEWAKTEEQWRQAQKERPDVLRRHLADKVAQRNGPEAILFGSGRYAGKTLKEVSDKRNASFVDILFEMGPKGASAAHFVMDEKLQDRIAVDPRIMISSDGSPAMWHPRGYGSFARVIHRYVMQQKELSLEEAVHKMTGQPAARIGLPNRGTLEVGNKADILVFDPHEVTDLAGFAEPHRLAEGFNWVWVNGKVARENGIFAPEGTGEMLKKQAGMVEE